MSVNSISDKASRLGGLWRFALAITVFNILGHTLLGFEQSWAQPIVALVTAYVMEVAMELIDAFLSQRRPYFAGGPRKLVEFLLSAHITALAVAMLIYTNERLWPVVFATATAIGSKAIFRVQVVNGRRHFFNPSNFGITITLLAFPWVGVAPPYHFTENIEGVWDWALPGLIMASGTFINARFTGRLPLIAGWLSGFALQALLRSLMFDTPIIAALLPMTGLAFILYTFYMVTDPATTPNGPLAQVVFGVAVAATYSALMVAHLVFGLFFALTIVCAMRGIGLYVQAMLAHRARASIPAQAATATKSIK
jgi:Na+-translocating ferredoxin:NAD+ oxidoreductase RnfD subunit